jgi:hypothetical protein
MTVSPNPTLAPGEERRFHQLPLISLLLAFVFPVYCLVVVFSEGLVLQGPFTVAPLALSVAAILGALVTGHLALLHARQYPPAQAGRGLAITALVLGYFSLMLVLLPVVGIVFSAGAD